MNTHHTALLITAAAALLTLTSCATDPATGRSAVSPEVSAAAGHFAVTVIQAAEAGAASRISTALRVHPDK